MLFFVLIQSVPAILLLALAGALYLTWYDIKDEDLEFQVKAWWVLLVLLCTCPATWSSGCGSRCAGTAGRGAASAYSRSPRTPWRRASLSASSSESRSSLPSSRPVTRSIRSSR